MLKKAGHIAIILLLIVSTGGVTISRHYCGSTLTGSSIFSSHDSCCQGPCKDCRNETKTVKVTDSFEAGGNGPSLEVLTKTLSDLFSPDHAATAVAYQHADLQHHYFPIKGPLILLASVNNPEASLQRFRL